MADSSNIGFPKLLYLVGQYPAINHGYLLVEITHLRSLGFDVPVVSISLPDRPMEKLDPEEREEAAQTYYVKGVPLFDALLQNFSELLCHPLRYCRGLMFALRLAIGNPRRMAYHLAYFAEGVLVGRQMRQRGVSHVHANFSATVALIMTRTFPVTMSFTVHGFGELHNPAETQLAQRVMGSTFVRSISRYGRGQLMLACNRSDWSKLLYVPLGIDASQFAPTPGRSPSSFLRILCVGRLAPEKGQALLLEATAALKPLGLHVHLRLVGDGPDRAWLERRAADLGIAGQVEFSGWIDHASMSHAYAAADLFVLPSLAEGIPVVLMEAMAMQLPCVAPRISGIPELIEEGVDGMLFAVGDVDDLSNAIQKLLRSPERFAEMGRRARSRVIRDYDIAANTNRFAAALSERLGRDPSVR